MAPPPLRREGHASRQSQSRPVRSGADRSDCAFRRELAETQTRSAEMHFQLPAGLLGGVIRAAGGGVGGASPPERCGLLLGLQPAGRLLRSSARAVAAVRGARSGRRGLKRLRGGRRIALARPRPRRRVPGWGGGCRAVVARVGRPRGAASASATCPLLPLQRCRVDAARSAQVGHSRPVFRRGLPLLRRVPREVDGDDAASRRGGGRDRLARRHRLDGDLLPLDGGEGRQGLLPVWTGFGV